MCVVGKLDDKRAPEADLRSVQHQPNSSNMRQTAPVSPRNHVSLCFSIFDDIGDYIPSSTSKPSRDKDRHRDRDRDREDDSKSRRHNYFEKPRGDEHQVGRVERGTGGDRQVKRETGGERQVERGTCVCACCLTLTVSVSLSLLQVMEVDTGKSLLLLFDSLLS